MPWETLKYSKARVDAAGKMLARSKVEPDDLDLALDVLANWRAAHSFALNTVQTGLRKRAGQCCDEPLIAQRLKRAHSIVAKLNRFPEMKLSRMQDLGGCRAVVDGIGQVEKLKKAYEKQRTTVIVLTKPPTDYIAHPKDSGYRGVHLIVRFDGSGKSHDHAGRLVEIQLRTKLQHAWATAVETVDAVLGQSLKASQGSEDWKRFFVLASNAFAEAEDSPSVPGLEDGPAAESELRRLYSSLKVSTVLGAYRKVMQVFQQQGWKNAHYFLLHLDPAERRLEVTGFKPTELLQATERYSLLEQSADAKNSQTVLVAADSLKALKRAYPNYYLDTEEFLAALTASLRD